MTSTTALPYLALQPDVAAAAHVWVPDLNQTGINELLSKLHEPYAQLSFLPPPASVLLNGLAVPPKAVAAHGWVWTLGTPPYDVTKAR